MKILREFKKYFSKAKTMDEKIQVIDNLKTDICIRIKGLSDGTNKHKPELVIKDCDSLWNQFCNHIQRSGFCVERDWYRAMLYEESKHVMANGVPIINNLFDHFKWEKKWV